MPTPIIDTIHWIRDFQHQARLRRRQPFVLSVLAALLVCSPHCAPASEIQYFPAGGSAPFSEAAQAGDFLFISGQIGAGTGANSTESFKAAARDAMDHISKVLLAHDSSFDHVVQCTVMLVDMNLWHSFNEVYVTYFKPGHLPARSAFGANGLANGAPLEVSCFAYEPRERR
jgi:2-iminobutanoate/2-iminopropanoate deaminase